MEWDARLAEVEQMMLTVRRPTVVQRQLAEKYGVTTRTVRKWIAKVDAKWAEHAAQFACPDDVREARRNKARETYELVISLALARTEVVKNEDGSVAFDDREYLTDGSKNQNYKRPITRAKPDLVRAVTAMLGIRHLDGLDAPKKTELAITGIGDRLPDLDSLPQSVRDHLVAGLEQLAPNGDLRKLAGDLFTSNARAEKLN